MAPILPPVIAAAFRETSMLDAVPFFFALGAVAHFCRSSLRLPASLYETLSIYLLLAIGLKGGVEIASSTHPALWRDALGAILLGALIPLLVFPLFRLCFKRADAASLAAHYGSVSIVTFAVASTILTHRGIEFEGHVVLLAALMEAPALIVATLLARLGGPERPAWGKLLHEVLANKSVLLLLGGILIGAVAGPEGTAPLAPLFIELFKGALCLFLLEMGLVAASQLPELKKSGRFLVICGLALPPLLSLTGWALAQGLGLSLGGTVLLMTLASSASYIAAPAAMRIAIPDANPGLGITAALAITFPFNLLLGIPFYIWLAGWLGAGA